MASWTLVHHDPVLNSGTGNINIGARLESTDTSTAPGGAGSPAAVIVLESTGGKVTQGDGGSIVADGLVLLGEGAVHTLDGPENDVGVIASNTGTVSFADS